METPTQSPKAPIAGKIAVVVIVALIAAGTAFWAVTDHVGEKGINPKIVKKMAKEYEKKVCLVHLKTKRACKQHIGRNHRECMNDSIERPEKGELIYNKQKYEGCMEQRRVAQSS